MARERKEAVIHEYSEEKQKLLIDILLSSEDIYARCQNILKDKYFVNKLRPAMRFIMAYTEKYSVLPKTVQVNTETGLNFEIIEDITIQHQESFLDEIEGFCKNRAIADAVITSSDLVEKGNYAEVERLVREAILISLQSDLGTNYFENPRDRLMLIKDKNGQVSTGWKTVDEKLYGGLNKGEISIFCGASGMGKSLFLQNISLNLIRQGLNVVYLSLELSEGLTSMRLDSMLTDVGTKEIFKKLDEVELKVRNIGFKSGALHVKQMPQGSTVNDIKAYLKNYEIQTQKRPDAIVVDYLDLLFPNSKNIDLSNLNIKDKFVTEELRGLGVERNIIVVTASQLNRSSVNEPEHDHSMIAGGISKIQTADNVMSIYASTAMKERGQYLLQFLKTRSSSGVGSKVYLGFDPNTLRIFDMEPEEAMAAQEGTSSADVFAELRRKNNKTAAPTADNETKVKDLSQLRGLIKR
jgi:archaellum biogenesis ATPase FlaH